MSLSLATNSDYKRSLLDSLELFRGVLPDDVHELLQRCDRRDVAEGELLLSPGAKNEHVFIVLSGSLNIHVGSPETPALATMNVGACVGEMSIIEDRDPSAFVISAEKSIPITEEVSEALETGQIILTYDKKKPAVWYDCTASKDWIAARGKPVESNLVVLDLLSELKRRDAFAILSYNIYVEKLENNNTNVIINIFAYPAQPKIKYSTEQIEIMSGQLMPQVFEVDISKAKFISKGILEDNFFKLIEILIERG